jgi:hypothetical protein
MTPGGQPADEAEWNCRGSDAQHTEDPGRVQARHSQKLPDEIAVSLQSQEVALSAPVVPVGDECLSAESLLQGAFVDTGFVDIEPSDCLQFVDKQQSTAAWVISSCFLGVEFANVLALALGAIMSLPLASGSFANRSVSRWIILRWADRNAAPRVESP